MPVELDGRASACGRSSLHMRGERVQFPTPARKYPFSPKDSAALNSMRREGYKPDHSLPERDSRNAARAGGADGPDKADMAPA